MDQYPNPQDMAAVQKGQAAAPIGTPLKASAMPWPPEVESTPATSPPAPQAQQKRGVRSMAAVP
jgi:penicillin-binding protein 2